MPERRSARYTGCQRMWLENGKLLAVEYFHDGVIQWSRIREPKAEPLFCAFKNGLLNASESAENCPPHSIIPQQ